MDLLKQKNLEYSWAQRNNESSWLSSFEIEMDIKNVFLAFRVLPARKARFSFISLAFEWWSAKEKSKMRMFKDKHLNLVGFILLRVPKHAMAPHSFPAIPLLLFFSLSFAFISGQTKSGSGELLFFILWTVKRARKYANAFSGRTFHSF